MLAAAPPQEQKQMLGKWNSSSYRLCFTSEIPSGFKDDFLVETLLSELLFFPRRTLVPSDSSYAPKPCWEDHRNAARDWQLGAPAHARVSGVPPVKGELACSFRWAGLREAVGRRTGLTRKLVSPRWRRPLLCCRLTRPRRKLPRRWAAWLLLPLKPGRLVSVSVLSFTSTSRIGKESVIVSECSHSGRPL